MAEIDRRKAPWQAHKRLGPNSDRQRYNRRRQADYRAADLSGHTGA